MRIGILTGGGDVPGLNPCIKAVVNRVVHDGHEVIGLRRGWAALLEYDPDRPETAADCFQPLDARAVRTIDRYGGTILHTSRTNPARVRGEDVPPFLADRAEGVGHQLRLAGPAAVDRRLGGVRPGGDGVAGGPLVAEFADQLERRVQQRLLARRSAPRPASAAGGFRRVAGRHP